ncbi:hypothetical protein B5G34_00275 [Flavonifractor sp. An82]|uniref:hypothetical protein n=1 Tax=Flavonifractor sp. An82 TaxID=1965660 RepID=UPI000B377508|nr:hypothetical protein [Flavonifractor sp. An82]OUN23573.1 hypothetical protein B5G34_00275 [Flavonifractor sp. An82]
MISFETFFVAIISIVVAYISIVISLTLERIKKEEFPIKKYLILVSVAFFGLVIMSSIVYHIGNSESANITSNKFFQPVVDFLLNSRLFPFYRPEFYQDYFVLVYIVGLVSFSWLSIVAFSQMLLFNPDIFKTIVVVCLFFIFSFVAINVEFLVSSFIYNVLSWIDIWVVVVGNILVNLIIGGAIVYLFVRTLD